VTFKSGPGPNGEFIEDEGQTAEIFVERGGDTSGTSVVTFDTSDGTGVAGGTGAVGGTSCSPGIDYITTHQVLTFAPGETEKIVLVPVCADSLVEAQFENVMLTLTGPDVVPPGTGVLLINDSATDFRSTAAICTTLGAPADPYPSTIDVSGAPPQVAGVRVTLYDIYHRLPDNLDVLLVGPQGQTFVLMGDAGGLTPIDPTAPVTLTLSDTAGQVLPNSAPLMTGGFEPTNWESPVTDFPAPAPPGPYNEPGSALGGSGAQTLNGTFMFTNPNGTWSLYVRDDAGLPITEAITGCISGGWGIEFISSTTAGASLSGRVTTADGRGIRNAKMVVTGGGLDRPVVATTGSFGYFNVAGLTAGQTYVVTVNSKRYTFNTPTRVITLVDNVRDVNFTANEGQ